MAPLPRMEIRDAKTEEAEAACQVLRRSITELRYSDHQNNPAIMEQWLGNKTLELVTSWISKPWNSVLVAAEEGIILAVGAVTDAGEIALTTSHRTQGFGE